METRPENDRSDQSEIQAISRKKTYPREEYASLIVRLWRLPEDQTADIKPDWRSEVEHIQSGEHWAFSSSEELEHFLSDFLRN
jgi:hypothetical protein